MLRQLGADDARFKTLDFHAGLNVLVADTTSTSRDTDSRNSAGKSSVIELLLFLLGGSGDKDSLPAHHALRDITFRLRLDWPGLAESILVGRSASRPATVKVEPPPPSAGTGQLDFGSTELRLPEWQRLIERDLFGLPAEHPGVSGRNLLSFLIRRISSHAFNSPTRSHPRASDAEGTTNLAYLFGLVWQLADRYRVLKAREATSNQLKRVANAPVLGRIVGTSTFGSGPTPSMSASGPHATMTRSIAATSLTWKGGRGDRRPRHILCGVRVRRTRCPVGRPGTAHLHRRRAVSPTTYDEGGLFGFRF